VDELNRRSGLFLTILISKEGSIVALYYEPIHKGSNYVGHVNGENDRTIRDCVHDGKLVQLAWLGEL